VVSLLARTGISPSAVTWVGFLLSVAAALLITGGRWLVAGLLVLVAGFLDALDGALARRTNRVTRFGAALDSSLDRLSEAALLLGILVWYVRDGSATGALLAGVTLSFSFMVSYIRARAEGLGLDCQVGMVTRPERVLLLVLGLLSGQVTIALMVIAALSLITAGQRLIYVWQQTKKDS
jgi:CDP-diacylglycerol--glycerol-3-phosphate 3-phosphatidyltransferase